MTVSVPGSLSFTYLEDGVTTVFSYPVRFLEQSELLVIREIVATGSRTTLILGADYTVSGANNPAGGSITRAAATNGGRIIITRKTAAKQVVDLADTVRTPAASIEEQLDRLAMVSQDHGVLIDSFEGDFAAIDEAVAQSGINAAAAAASAAQSDLDADRSEQARDAVLATVPNAFPATRAAMAALNTAVTTAAYLKEAGREGQFVWIGTNQSANVTLDARQGIYVPPASDPTGASGAWIRKFGAEILASWFGAVGDDVANDTAAWQGALKFAAGKTLCGEQGKTYNLTAELEMLDGCTLALRKSRMNFRVAGSVRCLVPGNSCDVFNGTIKNFGTTAGIAGDFQCPISIGKFTANVSVANVRVLNMTIESDWTEGNGIIITAASNNILVENIKFPDSPMFCPVLAHWGGTSAGTGHPYDVIIRNITCGNINPAGYLVSLAAAYNVLVENVKGGTCLYGFHNYAGDYTNMYASASVKPLVGKSVIARNIVATDVREAGIWVDGQSYNPALTTPTATPVEMDGIIEKCRFYGTGAIAQTPEPVAQWGAKIANCRDLEIRNNHFEWFQYGIVPAGPTERVYVVGNLIRACSSNGIVASFSSSSPLDWVVERNTIQGTNRNGYTTDAGAAILVGNARNAKILGNRIGFENSDFAYFGIRVTTAAISPVLQDNWVQKTAVGGAAYSIGTLTSYGINASGRNNRAAAGVTLWGGTTLLNDNGLGFREGIAVEGAAPSAGAWNVGDRLWAPVPTSTIVGYVCTAAGSPGTWRAFGT